MRSSLKPHPRHKPANQAVRPFGVVLFLTWFVMIDCGDVGDDSDWNLESTLNSVFLSVNDMHEWYRILLDKEGKET